MINEEASDSDVLLLLRPFCLREFETLFRHLYHKMISMFHFGRGLSLFVPTYFRRLSTETVTAAAVSCCAHGFRTGTAVAHYSLSDIFLVRHVKLLSHRVFYTMFLMMAVSNGIMASVQGADT